MEHREPLAARLASTVKIAIQESGRTQQEIANAADIPLSTLTKRLGGKHQSFDISELGDIAHELNVPVSDLLRDAERSAA